MTPTRVDLAPARSLVALLLTTLLLLAQATAATSHVTLTLLRIPSDTAMMLAFRAPIEREGTTNVKIESLVPSGFKVEGCRDLTGWTCTVVPSTDGTVVTWEAITVGTPNDLRFEFDVVSPSTTGLYRMPTIQTYSDGSESDWIAEDEPNPAPSVEVEHDIEPEEAPEPTPDPPQPSQQPTPQPTASSAPAPSAAPSSQPSTEQTTAEPSAQRTSPEPSASSPDAAQADTTQSEATTTGDEPTDVSLGNGSQEGGGSALIIVGLLVVLAVVAGGVVVARRE